MLVCCAPYALRCGGVEAASHRMGLLRRRYGVRSRGQQPNCVLLHPPDGDFRPCGFLVAYEGAS